MLTRCSHGSLKLCKQLPCLCSLVACDYVQRNAQKVQARLVNPHRTPVQQAADVVERVLATRGDDYLETQQHTLWWWQLAMLDVQLFLAFSALSIVRVGGLCRTATGKKDSCIQWRAVAHLFEAKTILTWHPSTLP